VDPNQYNNDMCYYESLDAVTWNFNGGMVNVSNYQTMDTLRAYCEVDAIYDYNDDLHLLWNTPYYDEIGGFISVAECLLWHWSEATGITFVADGWWFSRPGAWNRSISKMSLGVDEDNRLFALWTQFTEDDTSAAGWSNGELYMNYSVDGGATWSEPENITNSPTPGCLPGECDSDHWPTLNEVVDDSLYITYINDKDAGGIPQGEGVDTENPVMYLAVPKPVAQVSMTCTTYPVFCRGSEFLFRLVVRNEGSSHVSGTLAFSAYSEHDCDPGNLLISIPRQKTFAPGTTVNYYAFRIPNQIGPGPYSASVSGTLGGSDLYCCMNTNIIRCSPWKFDGNAEWRLVEVDRPEFELPTVTTLHQNYPNPFNAETNISYSLAEAGNVSLKVYDISGRLVVTVFEGYQEAGGHTVAWDASGVSSGIYFYKLETSDFAEVKKMNLLK
ncbi:MAG: T9SS type A sorting domain-containing protein, partial [Candidatus Zixiibacteriota bacterium]